MDLPPHSLGKHAGTEAATAGQVVAVVVANEEDNSRVHGPCEGANAADGSQSRRERLGRSQGGRQDHWEEDQSARGPHWGLKADQTRHKEECQEGHRLELRTREQMRWRW